MYDKNRELTATFTLRGFNEYLTDGFRKEGYITEDEFVKADSVDVLDGEVTFETTVYRYMRH